MSNYTQADFIESEDFNSDFYFEYLKMLKEFEESEEFCKLHSELLKGEDIDYDPDELPF